MPSKVKATASTAPAKVPRPSLVVGVGASAGGLEACQKLLRGAAADRGLAFVVVLHLAPAGESHLAEILQKSTAMVVSEVRGNETIEPNRVYVIAPGTSLGVAAGELRPGAPEEPHYRARPIDQFLSALAVDQQEAAVGIVLSGTGTDGGAGLTAIRAAGGLCLVQDPETAEYDGMPRHAIASGAADTVVAPNQMGQMLLRYAATPRKRPSAPVPPRPHLSAPREALPAVLELLGRHYRVDLRDYKPGTLERRTERRIAMHQLSGWPAYLEYLDAHPDEVDLLYRDLLIGVTSFFRDPEEWEALAGDILPELVEKRQDAGAVRLWSAGCATGEEPYSLAMVLLEHVGSLGGGLAAKVFASDASERALSIARRGEYPASIEGAVGSGRLRRFFKPCDPGFKVDRPLRDAVTFAAQDLLSDPPFAHLDMVSCRNVLIYLEEQAQDRLIELFHFSLRPGGILWLGSAETIGRRGDLFANDSAGRRQFFRSVGPPRGRRRQRLRRSAGPAPPRVLPERTAPTERAKTARLVEKLVLDRFASACVVVDERLEIRYLFGPTLDYLRQPQGAARTDLLSWMRPELYAKVRTGLGQALEHRRSVTLSGLRLERDTATVRVEIIIEPIRSIAAAGELFLVAFHDRPAPVGHSVTSEEEVGAGPSHASRLQGELEDTREELRAAVDQLRTATEEHGAGYEELLSLNEELQSSNEEIEASKEELQSLNEELTTINQQLEERNEELRTLTTDLNNLLVSSDVATLFLDRELRIRRFTPPCSAVMRILPGDVGRPLRDLKMQVRDDAMLVDARRVLEHPAAVEVDVSTEDGRWFCRRALPYRTAHGDVDGVCLTFHDITAQKRAIAASEHARLYAEAIIRTSRTPLLVLDMDHRLVSANAAFYRMFQVAEKETEGRRIYELGNGQWDIPRVRALLEKALLRGREIRDYDVEHEFERIGWRSMRLNAQMMPRGGSSDLILVSIEDVTDLRRAQKEAASRAEVLALRDRRKNEFLAMLGHELRNPLAALDHGLELLRASDSGPGEPLRTMMERQTRRIADMVDQLLDVARVTSGKLVLKREVADVTEAARAAVESVQPLLGERRDDLEVNLPPLGSAQVLGDPVRLAQVLENLLGNAAKYSDPGDRIRLTAEATEDRVLISVRDEGIGMEPEVLDHIFELFTQAPESLARASGGLGLGLPLVRRLVEMHDGEVEAHSAGPGKGTDVVVTLPRLRTGGLAPAARRRVAVPPPARRKILVVDDELDTALALVEILGLQGHDARAVPDGTGALAAASEHRPEVVLLDLGLPGMDGYEVARELRAALGPSVLLVALTGFEGDEVRLRAAGFDAHLLKPTPLAELNALLASLDARDRAVTSEGPPPDGVVSTESRRGDRVESALPVAPPDG